MGCDCENEVVEVCNQDGVLLQDLNSAELGEGTRFYVENDSGGGNWTGYWTTLAELSQYFSSASWGEVKPIWNQSADFGDYLLCDGRTVNYQNDTTGATDSIIIPDLRGRTIVMPDVPDALKTGVNALDQKTGWAKSMLQVEQMPAHGHSVTDPGHNHSIEIRNEDNNPQNLVESASGDENTDGNDTLNTNNRSTGITIADAGGGETHNNVQPSYGMNHFFYAKRPGWTITSISGVSALIPLNTSNFNENSLSDPNI